MVKLFRNKKLSFSKKTSKLVLILYINLRVYLYYVFIVFIAV